MGKQLLRRPRAPKPLPPLPDTPAPSTHGGTTKLNDYFESIDFNIDDDGNYKSRDATTIRHSPTPSVVPSLVSPPPSESLHRKSVYRTAYPSRQSRMSGVSRDEKKFVLDPLYRDHTSLGTYVDGKSLVKPYKPRGPDSLPARQPRKHPEITHAIDIVDDIRFYHPPAFTLNNFIVKMSDIHGIPYQKVYGYVSSRENYIKLTKMIADEFINPTNHEISLQHLTPEGQEIPAAEPRIPQRQLLIEMASMIKLHVRSLMNTEVKSVIRPLPKYVPGHTVGQAPHTEIILVEDDTVEISSQNQVIKQSREKSRIKEYIAQTELPAKDAMFHSARSKFFQGAGRSQSPFTSQEDGIISPSEIAILDSLIQGGKALSLKAHFICEMPDISPLVRNLVYLNLSFNDFTTFPAAVLGISQLQILKLRNNPLTDLPADIHRLKNLRTLVVSFCMIQSLPIRLFTLEHLEYLDISYNRITFIQNEISQLQSLRELNMEGNQLPAMPSGALRLDLDRLNVKNNFMHPLFWHENTHNEPQRLADMTLYTIARSELGKSPGQLPESVQRLFAKRVRCDCCNGFMFGPGLRIIRPVTQLFGIKNLPFMFSACSPQCLQDFRSSKETLSDILYGRQNIES
ncbi:leucine-rich repeat-containing protein 63-like isoform X1 [Dreissena polymorpha]|uniref:leucine-rich repeat-containing protein 63-like isoform X1 n=1 Tax=Dreissena polymorpha TaxID=45954 RepID=UPI00226455F9|nr:leucine-rich repeat-containing protein 63-like isoform X1 [Dreissena polymorpha]XP_052216237.1 leucine-rich repeat-containing protein 63-like isoform X1 [Dreissena polymorpha]XP_052216238.1 leucine-rich repeat-containing protein 63-like isoform X1 [Dreissena polymorpha]